MSDNKPGWKTTEFWLTLGTSVATVAVMVITLLIGGDTAGLHDAIVKAFAAVGSLVMSAAVTWKYIQSRTELKQSTSPSEEKRE